MRLIDADVMIKNLEDMKSRYDAITLDGMIKGLEQQLTAYDVDKVVEQIRDMQAEMEQFGLGDMPSDIIEIVKGGGVNE